MTTDSLHACRGPVLGRLVLVAFCALPLSLPAAPDDADQSDRWEKAIREFESKDKESPPPEGALLFVGSSSIRLWNLEESFPARTTINRGFGGSHVSDALQCVHRIVTPYAPRTIVMYAGDNDIAAGKTPGRVLHDFKAFVKTVHDKLPTARLVYIAIKPSIKRWKLVGQMREANTIIRQVTEIDPRLQFVDIDTPMIGSDGQPRAELFAEDGLHLSAKGYALWTSLLVPHLAFSGSSQTEDWPRWRGAAGVGISHERDLPTNWSRTKNVLWRLRDPGLGHSSPIIWQDKLFMTTAVDDRRLLMRLNPDNGEEVWRREVVRSPRERKHLKNSYASATPATDGKFVFVSFLKAPEIVVAAYDFQGGERWRVIPGTFYSMHGFCTTPILYEDLLILNCDQDHKGACIVALRRQDGKEVWRTRRENAVRSYCPPTIFEIDGKPQMILSGSKTVCSYDPRNGKRLWMCWGPTEQCVASVVYGEELVFVTGGYPDREFLAIDPTGKGDVTKTHVRWRARRGVSYVPSPLFLDGHFYVVSDSGILSALEAKTGRYIKQKRLGGDFSASLFWADDHIYCASEQGVVTVVGADPSLQTVAVIDMEDPMYASPVAADGRLYIRTWKHLYAIGSRQPQEP